MVSETPGIGLTVTKVPSASDDLAVGYLDILLCLAVLVFQGGDFSLSCLAVLGFQGGDPCVEVESKSVPKAYLASLSALCRNRRLKRMWRWRRRAWRKSRAHERGGGDVIREGRGDGVGDVGLRSPNRLYVVSGTVTVLPFWSVNQIFSDVVIGGVNHGHLGRGNLQVLVLSGLRQPPPL